MNSLKDYMKNVNSRTQADSSAEKAATSGTTAPKVAPATDLAGKVRAAASEQKVTTPQTQTRVPAADQTAAGSAASSGMSSLKDYMAKKTGRSIGSSAAAQPASTGIPRMKSVWSDPKARQTVLGNMGKDFEGYDGSWESAKSFLPGMEKGLGLQSSMIDTWQKEAEDLSRSLTAQYKQLEQMQADPMTSKNPYAAKRYQDAIDRYNKELEEYKQYVADIETAAGQYGTHYDKYKAAGDVYAGGQKSLPKWQQTVDSVLGADRTQVTGEKTDWWKLVKGTVSKGANQVNQGFWNTVNMFLGGAAEEIHTLGTESLNRVIDIANLIPGVDIEHIDGGKNFITRAYEDAQRGFQRSQDKYNDNANSSRAAQIVDKLGTSTIAAIPMALEAIILKPYYLAKAAQGATTAGLQYFSTLQNAKGLQAFSTMATEGMKKLFSNPQFWTSYLNVAGDGYEDAKKDGMNETDALLYGTVNGFFNAMIEIGGADETLGGIQNLPMRLDQMKGEAGKKQLVEWFKDSILGEGLEEVQQGAFERGLKAATTPDNGLQGFKDKWFSLDPTDQDAVFNPFTAGQEFTGGAVVGGILGGGQVGTSKVLQGLALPSVTEEDTQTKKTQKPEAERPTSQQFYDFLMRNGDQNTAVRNKDYIFLLQQTDEGDAWIGQIYEAGDDGKAKAAVYETAERTKEDAARRLANRTVEMEITRAAENTNSETGSGTEAQTETGSILDSWTEPAVESESEVPGLTLPSVEQETPAETKTKEGIEVAPGLRFIGSSPEIRLASQPASGIAPQPDIEGGTINGEPVQSGSAAAGSLPAAGTAVTEQPAGTAEQQAAAPGSTPPGGDGRRLPGGGAGEQAGRVDEGAGRVQANRQTNQAARAIQRRTNAQSTGEKVRLSAQDLGIQSGSARKSMTVYPESLWDDELKKIDTYTFTLTGKHTVFVTGAIEYYTSDGKLHNARGAFLPDGREIVQVDHSRVTATQIHDHEDWHRMEDQDPGLHTAVMDAIVEAIGEEQLYQIYGKYVEKLWGSMSLPENPTRDDVEKAYRDVEEEMLADMHGGINFAGIGADRYKSIIDGVLTDRLRHPQTRAATAATTGPPKYSFAEKIIPSREELESKEDIPVVDIREETNGSFADQRRNFLDSEEAKQLFSRPALNKDTGELLFITPASIKHVYSNEGQENILLVKHLFEIAENAILTQKEESRNAPDDHTTGVYKLFGAVQTEDGVKPVKLTVKEYSVEGQTLPQQVIDYLGSLQPGDTYAPIYDGKVLVLEGIEKETSSSAASSTQENPAPDNHPSVSAISVKDLLGLVKGEDQKYIPAYSTSAENEYPQGLSLPKVPQQQTGRTRYSYGGLSAENTDRSALEEAMSLDTEGVDNEEIRKRTGWFRGMDGKWRFEFDDSVMSLKPEWKTARYLGQLIDHPNLFNHYPALKYVPVKFDENETGAYYNIAPGDYFLLLGRSFLNGTDSKRLNTIAHEVQHAIQMEEGFTAGGTTELFQGREERASQQVVDALRQEMEDLIANVPEEYKKKFRRFAYLNESGQYGDELDRLVSELNAYDTGLMADYGFRDDSIAGFYRGNEERYRNLAGELESEDVKKRRTYTPMERYTTPPRGADAATIYRENYVDQSGQLIPAASESASEYGEPRGLSLPEPASGNSTTEELDSEGQELSTEQQEYFKDSKIRNEEGKLIPVYHGTDAEFTIFDRTKARANMDIQGNFFSPWEIDAAGYGSNVGVYYLNIKNPATSGVGYAALNRFKGQNNAGVKAREYLESLGYDGVNNDDEEYIAFYPEQIKRTDNKTPTRNPDIRFSSDEQQEDGFGEMLNNDSRRAYITAEKEAGRKRAEAASTKAEQEERERLAAAGAGPDVQPKTETPKATPKESKPILAKKNLRNQLITVFSIPEGRRAALGAIIDSYADRLYRHGEITQADRDALLDRLYSEGVMRVKHEDSGLEEHPRIYISPEIRAEFGEDWNDFRRRAFANGIYFTNSKADRGADSWQQTLAGKFAGIYDTNTDMKSFLETLVQIAQDSRDEQMTLDEYNAYLANEEGVDAGRMHDEMLNNLERQLDNALRNFADQANLEVYYRTREDRIRQDERRKAYEGSKEQRARQAAREAQEKERRNRMAQQHRENMELRTMQQRTLKQLQWLSKNRYRMPEELAATAKEILSDLDVYAAGAARATNYSNRYEATWEDIAKIYKEARATDPNFFPSQDLERIVARLDNAKIADLDPSALADLYKAAVGLRTEFYNKQNLINDQNHALFQDVYDDTREEMARASKTGKDNEVVKSLNLEMMTPANVLQMLFGWSKNSTGNRIAQQLTDGERNMKAFEVGAKALLDDFINEHQDWIKKADGQGKDAIWYEIEVPELLELRMGNKPIFGKTVKVYMTPAQKVQLAIEAKSKDNLRHMLGGRTFVNKDLYSKGKRAEAFAQGTTIKLAPETVESIIKDLTPEERELADILGNKYYNDYSGKKIDEVALKLYGYKKTMGGWYAPIFTNQNYTNNEAGLFDVTAEGIGNLKQRQVSKNPSYNISAFDAFEKNINMTKRFVGMAIPARNWQTLMNWQGEGTSFKDELTHQWGNEYKEYIQNLITRLQAGGSQGLKEAKLEKATNKLLSNYITSVFGSNPGIVFKQAASFPQFAAVMGWDTMPTIGQLHGVDTDLMQTYTPELAYRTLGYSTPETATLKENPSKLDTNPVTKFFLRGGAITWMDGETVKRAWPWAENYVRKNFPDLEIGSEEDIAEGRSPFYKKVAEVFNEAVGTTQPMYDEMHRPNIMKDSRGVQRAFTMFKTVPLQQYNTLRKAAGEAAAAKEEYRQVQDNGNEDRKQEAKNNYKDASKRMANAVTATIASVMLFNLIGFVDQLWRNRGKKYRDDEGNLTWNSVAQGLFSDSVDSVTGMVIYGQELTDLITNLVTGEKWYGIEIPGGEQLDEIIDQISTAADTIRKVVTDVADITAGGGDPTEYWHRHAGDFAGAIKDVAFTFSKYYNGLSAENIEKYIMGTLMTISPQTYTMLQDYFDTPAKYNLKGLTGEQFTQRAGDLFDSRNITVTDQQLRQLEQMYNDGYTDVIPPETASTITVNGTKYTLGANAQQIYDSTFAEYVNEGLGEILAGGLDERAASKAVQTLYNYAAAKAKEAAAADQLSEADARALKKSTAAADEVMEHGVTLPEWSEWKGITSEKFPDEDEEGEERSANTVEKLGMLRDFNVSDETKKALYGYLRGGYEMETEAGNPTNYAKMLDLTSRNMTIDEFIDWSIAYDGADKETDKLDALRGFKASEPAKQDLFGFIKGGREMETETGSPTQYAKMIAATKAGLTTDEYCTWLIDTADMKKDNEKLDYLAGTDFTDQEKLALIGNLLGTDMKTASGNPTQYAKIKTLNDSGISINDCIDLKLTDALDRYYNAQTKNKVASGDSNMTDLIITIEDELDKLKPANGDTQVDDFQKFEVIYRYGKQNKLTDKELLDICRVYASYDSYIPKLELSMKHNVGIDTYCQARTAMRQVSMANDNNITITTKEATAALNKMIESGKITKEEAAVLYQLQQKNWSYKNNPFDRSIGEQVYNELNSGTSGSSGSSSSSGSGTTSGSAASKPSLDVSGLKLPSIPGNRTGSQDNEQQEQQSTDTQSGYPAGLSLPSPYGSSRQSGSSGSTWSPSLPEQVEAPKGLRLPSIPGKGMYDKNDLEGLIAINEARGDNYITEGEPVSRYEYDRDYYNRGYDPVRTGEVRVLDPLYYEEEYYPEPILSPQDIREAGTEGRRTSRKAERRGQALGSEYRAGTGRGK